MRLPELDSANISYRFMGTTALDRFFNLPAGPVLYAVADTDMVHLSAIYGTPSFPGHPEWDLVVRSEGREVFLKESDTEEQPANPLSSFSWDPRRKAYDDRNGLYPLLKDARGRLKTSGFQDNEPVRIEEYPEVHQLIGTLDAPVAAAISARLPLAIPARSVRRWTPDDALPAIFHRNLLVDIITGPWPARGLTVLQKSGYLAQVIPELHDLAGVEHSKEGHPEGDAWQHTLETFRHWKSRDLSVGLALLFHDNGKSVARPSGNKRFDGHADIGARRAVKALERLGFSGETVSTVEWLIRYHMIPGALPRLPDHRRDPIMESPLFPLLLEVYRCDLSSTFRGPENYYKACTVYRRFLKNQRRRDLFPTKELVNMYVQ
jgi:poly(A) polymerase